MEVVSQTPLEPEAPSSIEPTDDLQVASLPGVAERRAKAQRALAGRGRWLVAEPAIALLTSVTAFILAAPTGLLSPLLGPDSDNGGISVSPFIWVLGALGLIATLGITGLRLRAYRFGDPGGLRHLSAKQVVLLCLGAATLAVVWLGLSALLIPR